MLFYMMKETSVTFLKRLISPIAIALCGVCIFMYSHLAHASPKVEHWTLESGAEVYWVASNSLPILDVSISFDAGSSRDPEGKTGLSSQVAMMSGKGILAGNDRKNEPALGENELTDAWLTLGAIFDVSSGRDEFTYTLRTLTYPEVMPEAIILASRVIAMPDYSQAVLAREQERMFSALKESLTRPATVASRAYHALVYSGHAYGRQVQEESIHAVNVMDLKNFHAKYILPCRARIVLVGDITHKQANRIAEQLLSRLPGRDECPGLADVAEVPPLAQAVEQHIAFDAAQAQIYIGQPGIKRSDPDFIPLVVANHILGGSGFSAKLMQEVREKRGLTYGIYSSFSPGNKAGAFTINLKTRPDQADEAVKVSTEVLKKFVEDGPTQQELEDAKASLLGGFPLMFDSNKKLLAQIANIAKNDLPLDYLDQWPSLIEAVTVEQIKAAMQRVIQPEKMVIVVLGAS